MGLLIYLLTTLETRRRLIKASFLPRWQTQRGVTQRQTFCGAPTVPLARHPRHNRCRHRAVLDGCRCRPLRPAALPPASYAKCGPWCPHDSPAQRGTERRQPVWAAPARWLVRHATTTGLFPSWAAFRLPPCPSCNGPQVRRTKPLARNMHGNCKTLSTVLAKLNQPIKRNSCFTKLRGRESVVCSDGGREGWREGGEEGEARPAELRAPVVRGAPLSLFVTSRGRYHRCRSGVPGSPADPPPGTRQHASRDRNGRCGHPATCHTSQNTDMHAWLA